MKRSLLFRQTFLLLILFVLCKADPPTCSNSPDVQCNVTSSSSTLDLSSLQVTANIPISIKYSGEVILDLTSNLLNPIVIEPIDTNDHTLQISKITTNASNIKIKIRLTNSQIAKTLFTNPSSIIAVNAIVIVDAVQNTPDASNFKIFDRSSTTTTMNFGKFELTVNATSSNVGNLNLPDLIYGLTNLTDVSISGSNHYLIVERTAMPSANNINRLSLKQLILQDLILVNFVNLKVYSIEQCTYNKTSLFLNSTLGVNVSLEMKNNNPIDSVLPYRSDAFSSLGTLTSLTLIESKLNSASLDAIKQVYPPSNVFISLNNYQNTSMISWALNKPRFGFLTIENIQTLDIFPAAFFSNFHQLKQVTLRGNFKVKQEHIPMFVGFPKSAQSIDPIITLDTTEKTWNNCTRTYIYGINIMSSKDIKCEASGSCEDCQRWYDETLACDLITYESKYVQYVQERLPTNYYYYNSTLYYFFENSKCIIERTTIAPPQDEKVNIGAIIGALCGLIVAAIILGITVYFVCRKRNRYENRYEPSAPQIKTFRSSSDPTNVSIATSKTSKSSRYALQKSFFPTIQPNDEIAPPLYTAPSESVASTSNYQAPSAPPAHRDSVSTHATHVYETVDP